MNAAFVEFVEDQEPDTVERRVVPDAPGQDPLGHHFDPCLPAHARLASHPKADGAAGGFAQRPGHEPRRGAGGQAPRLQHHDHPAGQPWFVEQRQRDARGLPGTRRGLKHGRGLRPEGGAEGGEGFVDREGIHGEMPLPFKMVVR